MPRILTRTSGLGAAVLALFAASGCGSGGSGTIIHTGGSFSPASLKGSYVFQIHGELANGAIYREAGVVTADGAGHITNGVETFTTSSTSGGTNNIVGTYSVGGDGSGFINIPTGISSLAGVSNVNIAITLISTSEVDLLEADNFASGAGTAELQDSTAIGAAPSGTFVFRLHQEFSAQGLGAASQAGGMTISSGSIPSGALDQNLGGTSSQLSLTSGSFSAPVALGTGTGTFKDSNGFSTNFQYYIVNSGKFWMLISNSGAVGSGSAEAQTGNVSAGLSGSYAFGARGEDSGIFAGIASVGQFTATPTSSGTGTISGNEDFMEQGSLFQNVAISGCYATGANGRVVITSTPAPPCSGSPVQVFWMVNPSRAFFLNNNASQEQDGTADLQSTTSFSASSLTGQYAMVMDGIDVTGEALARIGPAIFDGASTISIAELANGSSSGVGAQSFGLKGNYQTASNGRTTASLSNSSLDLILYPISGSSAYVLQVDPNTNTSGTMTLQH